MTLLEFIIYIFVYQSIIYLDYIFLKHLFHIILVLLKNKLYLYNF